MLFINAPGLPPTRLVAQHPQLALHIETRLLQRLITPLPGQYLGTLARLTLAQACGNPGLIGTIPLDPGQALAIATQGRRGVKVRAFDQHLARAIGHVDAHQAMLHRLTTVLLLQRQHGLTLRVELQVAIATIGPRRQRPRRRSQVLPIQLLIGFIDEGHTAVADTESATAVFIHPAAQGKRRVCQALRLASTAEPQAGAAIGRIELRPQHPAQPHPQLGKVATGSSRISTSPSTRPEAVGLRRVRHA